MKKRSFKLSFCVVCMNRLYQLEETFKINILDNLNYKNLEFILLDYNSEDGMDDWAKMNLMEYIEQGRVVYYKTFEPQKFSHSHAKNLAFKLATGEIVCNINADHFTGKDFSHFVNHFFNNEPNVVLTPIIPYASEETNKIGDILGKVCVKKNHFLKINGFDEQMTTYGFEDFDFINRLEMIGIERRLLKEPQYLRYLPHDNVRFAINELYGNLELILINYISPSESEVIFMYNNGRFEMGQILDNTTSNSEKLEYSYQKRHFMFKFVVKGIEWEIGTWLSDESKSILHFTTTDDITFEIVNRENDFKKVDCGSIFFELTNFASKKDLLNFHHFYKNRSKLEVNIRDNNVCANFNGFGHATVYKNFKLDKPLIIA